MNRFSRVLSVGCALLLAPGMLVACGDGGGGDVAAQRFPEVAVLASTSIWADVTSSVACDAIEVRALIPAGADAHSFEPSVQDADALRSASLVIVNGLGLEDGLHDAIDAAESDGVTVVELAPDLSPLEAADGHDEPDGSAADDEHAHGVIDAHVWMDPDRVAAAVPLIAEALVEVDGLPVDAEQIQVCADDYLAELEQLSAEMDRTLAVVPTDERHLVTNHEALGYFADRFDFEVVGAVIPSASTLGEPNARALDELATTMQDLGVTTIFAESTGSDDVASALAERVDSAVTVVDLFTESLGGAGSSAETYPAMMRENARIIASNLAG